MSSRTKDSLLWRIAKAGASFGIATVIFIFLTLIVWLGTLGQVDYGLFEAQKKYFESYVFIEWVKIGSANIGIPLPGGYLLMILLFINMGLGLALKIRKDAKRVGMLIVHGSVLFLLLAGWVSFQFKTEGAIKLYEGQSSNVYRSYTDWVLEIIPGDKSDILEIPEKQFAAASPETPQTFKSPALPFDIEITHYASNSRGGPAADAADFPIIDSSTIIPMERDPQREANIPSVALNVAGEEHLIWGLITSPIKITSGEKDYLIRLAKKGNVAPYSVRLDKFTKEDHPNTGQARVYESDITQIFSDGADREVKIEMNEPLRDKGLIFFQSGFGPQPGERDRRPYSVLAVVTNPSDQWPTYFVFMVTAGLVIHFIQKSFLRRKAKKA
ncbi:cytochrome c biogenesis protein ResB [Verrucomicrobiales bacterium]|nr:cytochrome c biogenesis protein ResB [Verrucomicrobiales bacterium]